MDTIRDYISLRYPNWLDYARYQARVNNFEGWEEDLLNDVVCDLMKKDEAKLLEMLHRQTKKIVNGVPTTELDKFVLKMLKLNATSTVAPFRKNTLGNKIISRENGEIKTMHRAELNGHDCHDEEYDPELNYRLDAMHDANIWRLRKNGYTRPALDLYRRHFIRGAALEKFTETEQDAIQRIRQFLVITKKTLLDES
jgi:hypothetical protein